MITYKLTSIAKAFGSKRVLDIDHFSIEEGQIICLLGANGAGKTTLLRILAFLDAPTEGQVEFYGYKVAYQESHLQPLRRNVVMLNQDPILFSTTVFRNIEFGLRIRKVPKRQRSNIIHEVLDLVGMRRFAQTPATILSSGEARRVSLARALALQPKVLLCDEPTVSVDLENQAVIFNILRQINQEKGTTLILTTHDRFQPVTLSQRTVFLNRGSLSSSAVENIYTGVIHDIDNGKNVCCIQNSVEIPINGIAPGKVRISLDARKISLYSSESKSKDVLEGRVVQIGEDNGDIRIVIDAKIILTLLLSKQAYAAHPIKIGQTMKVHIPSEAIRFLD